MKKYEQLSLFDEDLKETHGNIILSDILGIIGPFETEEIAKEKVPINLVKILELYSKYDPNIEIQEQLSCMGAVRLLALKKELGTLDLSNTPDNQKELIKKLSTFEVRSLKDFNFYVGYLVKSTEKGIVENNLSTEKSVICLIQMYFNLLVSLKEVLGV